MSGINPGVLLAVCQVAVDFRDDIGNLKSILGSGFWVQVCRMLCRGDISLKDAQEMFLRRPPKKAQLMSSACRERRPVASGCFSFSERKYFHSNSRSERRESAIRP